MQLNPRLSEFFQKTIRSMDGANELGTGIPPTTQEFKKIITQSHLPKVCFHAKSHSEFKAKAKSISKIPASNV